MKKIITAVLKGLTIGGLMTVPGISGGTIAMILGIYKKLISAMNGLFERDKKSFLFLLQVGLGGLAGIVLFSGYVLGLYEKFPMPMSYFFIGAVLGGAPFIYKSANEKKFRATSVLYPLIGIVIVTLITLLPEGIFTPGETFGIKEIALQMLGGVIVAIAFVLPGISVSQMLLMLGLYETTMHAVHTLNVLPLIPLGVGVALGTVATAKLMDKAINRFPNATYLIIFEFILGSVRDLFPGIPSLTEGVICIVTAVAGFFAIYTISKKTEE